MDNFMNQFKDMIAGLSLVRKLTMGIVLAVAVGSIFYVIHASGMASMEPLYTNLNSQDMGSILTLLDKQGVRYQVDQEKRVISVPATSVLDIRLKLAAEGLPRFGGVGFELFDKSGFGMSEFEQRINYQRALEGELARTVGGIREVESARVHLVLPEKSLFNDSQQAASASVILKLGGSGGLNQSKVNAITHIVASAVEGLEASDVSVMDTAGNLLSEGRGDPAFTASSQIFEQKLQMERSLEKRISDLLTPVVGLGKAIVHVTANIDFTKMESTDEVIDPTKTAVVSESRTNAKKSASASGAGGAAGAAANQAGGAGGGAGGGEGSTSDEGSEQISYQVSKTIRHLVSPIGALKSLSVAVLVDGAYTTAKDGKKAYAARTPEELKKFEDLVKSAIGFSTDRGDQIKIENLAFQTPEEFLEGADAWYKKKSLYGLLGTLASNLVIVISFVLILLFVLRPLMRQWQAARGAPGGGGENGLIPGSPQLVGAGGGSEMKLLVQSNPAVAANAIREWLK